MATKPRPAVLVRLADVRKREKIKRLARRQKPPQSMAKWINDAVDMRMAADEGRNDGRDNSEAAPA